MPHLALRRPQVTRLSSNNLKVWLTQKRVVVMALRKHVARRHDLRMSAQAPSKHEQVPLDPDIAELVPARFTLDLDLDPQHLQIALDTAQLDNADSSFAQLWSRSRTMAVAKMHFRADKGLAKLPGTLADNQLALQCGAFCEQLGRHFELQKPDGRHLDFWILVSLCLKVHLQLALAFSLQVEVIVPGS